MEKDPSQKERDCSFQRAGCLPGGKKGKRTSVSLRMLGVRSKVRVREASPFRQGVLFPLIKSGAALSVNAVIAGIFNYRPLDCLANSLSFQSKKLL